MHLIFLFSSIVCIYGLGLILSRNTRLGLAPERNLLILSPRHHSTTTFTPQPGPLSSTVAWVRLSSRVGSRSGLDVAVRILMDDSMADQRACLFFMRHTIRLGTSLCHLVQLDSTQFDTIRMAHSRCFNEHDPTHAAFLLPRAPRLCFMVYH